MARAKISIIIQEQGSRTGHELLLKCSRSAQPYIRRYTSPNENFEYSYPLIIYLLHISRAMRKQAFCIMKTREFNAYQM